MNDQAILPPLNPCVDCVSYAPVLHEIELCANLEFTQGRGRRQNYWSGTRRGGLRRISQSTGAFATTLVHALGDPNSPVCGKDEVKLFLGYGVQPAADNTSAGKCESVFAVAVDNGEFHIAVERSGIYWLPVHNEFIYPQT
jgi:hypothetical protein